MSLTQQFLITLSLPGAFLALFLYYWNVGGHGTPSTRYWRVALITGAFWASSILSFYAGTALPQELALGWRIAGRHVLSLLSLLLLLTTTEQMATSEEQVRVLAGISVLFWLASLFLDPMIWAYELPSWALANQQGNHFALWAGVWVTSWFLPLLAASLLTRHSALEALSALHRNRLYYWLLTLLLFIAGGAVALIQQPGQPIWQELGALILIPAALLGTMSLAQVNLPNLRTALRHTAARLTTTLLIFGLTWVTLWLFARILPRSEDINSILHLFFAAAFFTALFMAVNRVVPRVIKGLFLPTSRSRATALSNEPELTVSLLDPQALARFLLRLVQFNLENESGWLLRAEEGSGGALTLYPLASLSEEHPPVDAIRLSVDSPFSTYLRRTKPGPLSVYEMDTLSTFASMPDGERNVLQQWQSELFMPLCAGDQLVGVLVLGEKYTGEPYNHPDFSWLQEMSAYGGPLLWQAQNLQRMGRVSDYAFDQVHHLAQEKQQLNELLLLHERFTQLVSPRLRQPFAGMYASLQQLEGMADGDGNKADAINTINRHLAQLRVMINNLILMADRVQKQRDFCLVPFQVDEAVEKATRNLSSMAAARSVEVATHIEQNLPYVNGDEQRLTEAIQYLLHNAIKFNKIGGMVEIECSLAGHELGVHVRDSGVGIPPEQLEDVWHGFTPLHSEPKRSSAGLGLLLTRFIVRAHGGRVEAESEYGAGSTFSIYLPLHIEDEPVT